MPSSVITAIQQSKPSRRQRSRHRSGHPAQNQRKRQTRPPRQRILQPPSHIKQSFGRNKQFNNCASRCENTACNFLSIVSCAVGLCLIQLAFIAKLNKLTSSQLKTCFKSVAPSLSAGQSVADGKAANLKRSMILTILCGSSWGPVQK